MHDNRNEDRWNQELKRAWSRYMAAERRALASRAQGRLARALGEALPGEIQEELDRMSKEDRRLAREGSVSLI